MNLDDVYLAANRLKKYLNITPLLFSSALSQRLDKQIWLKLETQLPTGSFKPRAAFNSILSHLDMAKKKGVIASSLGNFAQAVAYAANQLQVNSLIVMTDRTSPYKIRRTQNFGAEVVITGSTQQDRMHTTLALQKKTGRFLLHPYDSEETIAGDATIGLELGAQLLENLKQATILVPVSGGGLIAGIALTIKSLYPLCKIIAVQPSANQSLFLSLQAGKCIAVPDVKTIADVLVATAPGEKPFQIIQQYVDDIVLVEENEIKDATQFLIEENKLVVEPSGAVTVAALLAKKIAADNVICIISGGNINLTEHEIFQTTF